MRRLHLEVAHVVREPRERQPEALLAATHIKLLRKIRQETWEKGKKRRTKAEQRKEQAPEKAKKDSPARWAREKGAQLGNQREK